MNATARALFECAIAGASVKPVAEFAGITTDAAKALVVQHPKPTWRAILRQVNAENYRVQTLLNAMFAPALLPVGEGGEYPLGDPHAGLLFAAEVAVQKYGRALPITRESVINDRSLGFLADTINSMTAAAYRREADAVFAALADNADLADGNPWFTGDNAVSEASVPTAVMAGMDALRSQTYPDGQRAHLEPYALVIPASWHIEMTQLDAEFLARPPLILRSAALTDGYVIADPTFAPALALVTLNPGGAPDFTVSGKAGNAFGRELHSVVKVRHEFAVCPLARVGIVRMTATGA